MVIPNKRTVSRNNVTSARSDIESLRVELQFELPRYAANPPGGVLGQLYYNTADGLVYRHNGTTWDPVGGSADADTLTEVLVAGNETGANDIVLTDGQSVRGENANAPGVARVYGGNALSDVAGGDIYVQSGTGGVTNPSGTVFVRSGAGGDENGAGGGGIQVRAWPYTPEATDPVYGGEILVQAGYGGPGHNGGNVTLQAGSTAGATDAFPTVGVSGQMTVVTGSAGAYGNRSGPLRAGGTLVVTTGSGSSTAFLNADGGNGGSVNVLTGDGGSATNGGTDGDGGDVLLRLGSGNRPGRVLVLDNAATDMFSLSGETGDNTAVMKTNMGMIRRVTPVSASPYNVQPNDDIIVVATTAGVIELNLPSAPPNGSTLVVVKDTADNNAVNINATGGDTVTGIATLSIAGGALGAVTITYVTANTNWSQLTSY